MLEFDVNQLAERFGNWLPGESRTLIEKYTTSPTSTVEAVWLITTAATDADVAVAVMVTDGRVPDVAMSVLAPCAGPSVQLPTLAVPSASVITSASV